MREIVIRAVAARGLWEWWRPISSIVALSGVFEIIEMIVAQIVGSRARRHRSEHSG
jgi:hypothetical protein